MNNTNNKSAVREQHLTESKEGKLEKLLEFLMKQFAPYVTEDVFDFEETDDFLHIYMFGGYRISINKDADYSSTNQRIASIKIMDDNWFWDEYFLIDESKEKEFRKYVKSDEFADFVCDLIGTDVKGLDGRDMWKFREKMYKTGIEYFKNYAIN